MKKRARKKKATDSKRGKSQSGKAKALAWAKSVKEQLEVNIVEDQTINDAPILKDSEGEEPALIRSLIKAGNVVSSFVDADGASSIWNTRDISSLEISKVKTLQPFAAYAKQLKKLKTLNLTWPIMAATTTDNINPLRELTGLRELSLWECPTDSLEPLANLSKLRVFNFGGNDDAALTDISALAHCENLIELTLDTIAESNLKPLSRLVKLRKLHLARTDVLDLKHVGKLEKLESLTLYWTGVDDVKPLRNLKKLKHLEITPGKDVSSLQLERLQKALPKCKSKSFEPCR